MTDPCRLSLAAASDLLERRELSSVEYVQAHLARIAAIDGRINSYLDVFGEQALPDARVADAEIAAGGQRGPLHGVPIALKDLFDVAGHVTTAHSKIPEPTPAASDAFVVALLRKAGAILIGKTALHEFATGGPSFDLPWPPARNPWAPTHHPGGSSSGSGAAVAARLAPAALGTDTGGSVRNPATCCGVVGMKPTYGVVSRTGVFPLAFSLDHVGPLTRTVEDNAIVMDALLGRDPADPTSVEHCGPAMRSDLGAGVRGLTIGLIEAWHDDADSEITAAIGAAVAQLSALGARIVPLAMPPLDRFSGCGRIILQAEGYAVHERWLATRGGDYGARTRMRLLPGAFIGAADYIRAQQLRGLLAAEFQAAMAGVDAAIAVSSLALPCPIDDDAAIDRTYDRQARMPFNVTGTPALAVPIGFSRAGLPIGMQFAGKGFDEARLYRIAHAYEQATGWHLREPALEGV